MGVPQRRTSAWVDMFSGVEWCCTWRLGGRQMWADGVEDYESGEVRCYLSSPQRRLSAGRRAGGATLCRRAVAHELRGGAASEWGAGSGEGDEPIHEAKLLEHAQKTGELDRVSVFEALKGALADASCALAQLGCGLGGCVRGRCVGRALRVQQEWDLVSLFMDECNKSHIVAICKY